VSLAHTKTTSIMKTINSFFEGVKPMKLFAIATVALTSVFGFTSCDKNDDAINEAATPIPPKQEQKAQEKSSSLNYFGAQVFINDDVLEYGDFVITVNHDGKSEEYKVSEGQTVTFTAGQINKAANNADTGLSGNSYSGKMLTIPNFKAASGTASFDTKFVPNQAAFDKLTPETELTSIILPSFIGAAGNNVTPDCLKNLNIIGSTSGIVSEGHKRVLIGTDSDYIMKLLTTIAGDLCIVIK